MIHGIECYLGKTPWAMDLPGVGLDRGYRQMCIVGLAGEELYMGMGGSYRSAESSLWDDRTGRVCSIGSTLCPSQLYCS